MDLTQYVDDLQRRLATAAEAGGDDARQLAERLTAPLDAAARLILLDLLSAAAAEISGELAPGSVDVRLRAGEPEFVVSLPDDASAGPVSTGSTSAWLTSADARPSDHAAEAPPVPDPAQAPSGTEAGTTRTTLRLPDHLKSRVETAAARDGVSVNTWLVRAVAAAIEPGTTPTQSRDSRGNRITGWVR